MTNGQSEFDKYRRNYDILRRRGMVTRTQTIADSQGGTYERQYKEFDINALTVEERKQYALAKSITEGETRIQQGISAYAQAVSEGTSAAREQFKGNRYALQGAGGGGGGRSGGGKAFDAASIAFNVPDVVKPENMIAAPSVWKDYAEGIKGTFDTIGDSMSNLTQWTENFDPYKEKMDTLTKAARQQQMAFSMAGEAANNFGAALASIDDPGAKAAGNVIQAISSIALGFAMASSNANTAGTGWGWLAWLAAGTAAMATTISTIHSLTGYAEGGMVGGTSYSGDNIPIMANAGELVLTKAQQNTLAQNLQSSGMGSMNLKTKVKGTELLVWLDNSLAQSGRGELVTWGQ
jgi:hypothetical protein